MTPHPFSIKLDQTSVVPLNEQLTKALQEEISHRLQPGAWPNASASRAIP